MKPETKPKKKNSETIDPTPATESKDLTLFRLLLRLDLLRSGLQLKDALRGSSTPILYDWIDDIEILSRQLI